METKVGRVIRGLVILKNYDCDIHCEHDTLWAKTGKKVEDNNFGELKRLGWSYDKHHDSWFIFT